MLVSSINLFTRKAFEIIGVFLYTARAPAGLSLLHRDYCTLRFPVKLCYWKWHRTFQCFIFYKILKYLKCKYSCFRTVPTVTVIYLIKLTYYILYLTNIWNNLYMIYYYTIFMFVHLCASAIVIYQTRAQLFKLTKRVITGSPLLL